MESGGCGCAECTAPPEPSPAPPKRTRPSRIEARLREAERTREPATPKGWLGIDVGFIFPAVDSDGKIYRWARVNRHVTPDTAFAGQVTVRRVDGRTYTQEAYDQDQLADVFARAEGENYRITVARLAQLIVSKALNSGRGIALEDWSDFKRRRAAWVDLWKKIRYVAEQRGCAVRMVPSAWTSTTCPECGHQDPKNRPRRDAFKCLRCGHAGQSDRIAARNIMAQAGALDTPTAATVCRNPACDRPRYRGGLCLRCYFFSRRHDRLPSKEKLDELAEAKNYEKMKREWLEQV